MNNEPREHATWLVRNLGTPGATLAAVDGAELGDGGRPFYPALAEAGRDGWTVAAMDGDGILLILTRPIAEDRP